MKADPKGVCAFFNDCDTGVKLSPSSCMLHFHFAGRWLRQSCPHNIEQLHPGLLNIFPRGCFVSSCCGSSVGTPAVLVVNDSFLFSLLFLLSDLKKKKKGRILTVQELFLEEDWLLT